MPTPLRSSARLSRHTIKVGRPVRLSERANTGRPTMDIHARAFEPNRVAKLERAGPASQTTTRRMANFAAEMLELAEPTNKQKIRSVKKFAVEFTIFRLSGRNYLQ